MSQNEQPDTCDQCKTPCDANRLVLQPDQYTFLCVCCDQRQHADARDTNHPADTAPTYTVFCKWGGNLFTRTANDLEHAKRLIDTFRMEDVRTGLIGANYSGPYQILETRIIHVEP